MEAAGIEPAEDSVQQFVSAGRVRVVPDEGGQVTRVRR
jgi:hypothetical protein